MSIATKLQAILSAKGDIKAAIEGKGVTVGNASLDQYANLISQISGGTPLPYDAEVEYLETGENQWINTGVVVSVQGDFRVEQDLMIITPGANRSRYLICLATDSSGVQVYTNGLSIFLQSQVVANFKATKKHLAYTNLNGTQILVYDNVANSFTTSDTSEYSLAVCGYNRVYSGGTLYSAPHRTYNLQLYKDGGLVRDFIPVRVGQVGYMYDKVSKQLFGNAGTGSFTFGADVISDSEALSLITQGL